MERRVLALLLSVVAAAMLSGTAAAGKRSAWPALPTAGPFLVAHIDAEAKGRWATVWNSLYPLHKRIVAQGAYARCEAQTPFAVLPLGSVHVVRVRRAPVVVPGLAHAVAGVAVTVRAEFQGYGPRDPVVITHTFHLVPVGGRWRWLLSPSRYQLYLRRGCGAPSE